MQVYPAPTSKPSRQLGKALKVKQLMQKGAIIVNDLVEISNNVKYRINSIAGFNKFIDIAHRMGYTWYRGQSVSDWDIVPGLTRSRREPEYNSNWIECLRYETINFNETIDKALYIVNNNSEFKAVKELNLNRLQFMLLAQHYGLTTPIVDWTTNPDIALFFALDYLRDDGEFSPVLYATNPKLLNEYSDVLLNGESKYEIFSADNNYMADYLCERLHHIEGKEYEETNSFVTPVAIESKLDFSHRITFQSGKFTINGPKKLDESVNFKNYNYDVGGAGPIINMTAEIDKSSNLFSDLDNHLLNFGYTKESVYRLGDSKSKLLDTLFKKIGENYIK